MLTLSKTDCNKLNFYSSLLYFDLKTIYISDKCILILIAKIINFQFIQFIGDDNYFAICDLFIVSINFYENNVHDSVINRYN